MSFTFTVETSSLPAFFDLVRALELPEPLRLAGAGFTSAPWPKGLFAKIADASTVAASMELTPDTEAAFERAGLHGSFLAYVAASARGVAVTRTARGLAFSVLALSSKADYALAVRLAAATASLTGGTIGIEEPDAGSAVPAAGASHPPPNAGLSAEQAIARFDASFAESNAAAMGTWLAADIAEGRTYFFQTPRGWVELRPADLANTDASLRFARARELVMGDAAPAHIEGTDPRREAVLLTAAMVFAAGADGKLDDEEARQLEAHFTTVKELRPFPARELLDAARGEVADVRGLDALRELRSPALRKKAFVLAGEVIASAREGNLTGAADDPNVKAVSALANALGLESEPTFVAQVVAALVAKYAPSPVTDDVATKLVLGMLLAAAADGVVDDDESRLLAALARTVPELKTRDVPALFAAAKGRMANGLDASLADLRGLDAEREKCFALAAEVALVAGRGDSGTLLPRLRENIRPDATYAECAIATFAAKYA